MFLEELNISEFRGIKKTTKPIKLSNFTVLIGRNNSGKSAILEAISLFPGPSQEEPFSKKSRIDKLLNFHPSQLSGFRKLIYRYEGSAKLEYKIDNKILSILLEQNDIKLFSGNKLLNSTNFGLEYETLFFPNDTSLLEQLELKIDDLSKRIEKRKIHRSVIKSLNECIDDNYSEIVFLKPISVRKVFEDDSANIELNDLGSGAEKVVKLMSIIEVLEPNMLLLDDIEAGLHPSLIKMFLKWLSNKKWQTVISTHSVDVLYYLNDFGMENCKILQLKKSREDIMDYKELEMEDLGDLLDGNIDPRLMVDL